MLENLKIVTPKPGLPWSKRMYGEAAFLLDDLNVFCPT